MKKKSSRLVIIINYFYTSKNEVPHFLATLGSFREALPRVPVTVCSAVRLMHIILFLVDNNFNQKIFQTMPGFGGAATSLGDLSRAI